MAAGGIRGQPLSGQPPTPEQSSGVRRVPIVSRPKWKVCLVGSTAVGKTSLIRRFVVEAFDDKYIMTLGTKVSKKSVEIPGPSPSETVVADLAIWDIMGQPSFMDLLKDSFFSGAHGIIAVADSTRRSTLQDLQAWIRKVREVAGPVPMVLAINKSDRSAEAEISQDEIRGFAGAYGCNFFLTSAKTGDQVQEMFLRIAQILIRQWIPRLAPS